MARNRKNVAAELRFGPVVKVVLLCLLVGGSAIGFVWQKSQVEHLGRQIRDDETRLAQLKSGNNTLREQIEFLRSPVMLDSRVKQLNLGLAPAQPLQVVRLTDLPLTPNQDGPRQFAQRPVAGETQ